MNDPAAFTSAPTLGEFLRRCGDPELEALGESMAATAARVRAEEAAEAQAYALACAAFWLWIAGAVPYVPTEESAHAARARRHWVDAMHKGDGIDPLPSPFDRR